MSQVLSQVGLIRRLSQPDFPQLLAIERKVFEIPWTEQDLTQHYTRRNVFGLVAEVGGEIGAYCVYEMNQSFIHLDSIAVHPSLQRLGYGQRLLAELKTRLTKVVRPRILTDVRETNLKAHCFFRANKFRAVKVLPAYYDVAGKSEDSYLFSYHIES